MTVHTMAGVADTSIRLREQDSLRCAHYNRVLILDYMSDMVATPRGDTFRDWVFCFLNKITDYKKRTNAKVVVMIIV